MWLLFTHPVVQNQLQMFQVQFSKKKRKDGFVTQKTREDHHSSLRATDNSGQNQAINHAVNPSLKDGKRHDVTPICQSLTAKTHLYLCHITLVYKNTRTGSMIFPVLSGCADSTLRSQRPELALPLPRQPPRLVEFVKLCRPVYQGQDCWLQNISTDCSIPADEQRSVYQSAVGSGVSNQINSNLLSNKGT